jgi:hypothetical protein
MQAAVFERASKYGIPTDVGRGERLKTAYTEIDFTAERSQKGAVCGVYSAKCTSAETSCVFPCDA